MKSIEQRIQSVKAVPQFPEIPKQTQYAKDKERRLLRVLKRIQEKSKSNLISNRTNIPENGIDKAP
jgi:hypothetical protein